jgi:hypothetical protein
MNRRTLWSVVVMTIGLVAMLVGAIDPLEGSFVILPGSGIVLLGALLGKSRHRLLLLWAFVLIGFGVAAMVVFTMWGGIGGNSGNSVWWGLCVLPYPAGWIAGLIGAILALIEPLRHRHPTTDN